MGRNPEKARMSKGIGAPALRILEDICYTESGCYLISQIADVPSCFRLDGRIWPIGLYLRNKLRDRLNIPRDMRHRDALFDVPMKDFYALPTDTQQDLMEWEGYRGETAFFQNHEEHDLMYKKTSAKNYVKIQTQTSQLPQVRKTARHLKTQRENRARYSQGSVKI